MKNDQPELLLPPAKRKRTKYTREYNNSADGAILRNATVIVRPCSNHTARRMYYS